MVNSGRQFGGVFGASILVVVLGKAAVTGDPSRFYALWWVAVALCAAAIVVSFGLTPKHQPAEAETTPPEAVAMAGEPLKFRRITTADAPLGVATQIASSGVECDVFLVDDQNHAAFERR